MRQLNFDLKTLQARHREGAFNTRRDRAYVLDQMGHRPSCTPEPKPRAASCPG